MGELHISDGKISKGSAGITVLFLLVIVLFFTGCSKPSVDTLLDEFDSILTEYFTLLTEQNELDPVKMAKLTKLTEKIGTLYVQFERIDESTLTEEQLTKLFTSLQKFSLIDW